MTYTPIYGARRRRCDWRPAAAGLVLVAGVLALVAVAARPPKPTPAAPPPPRVGELLHAGQHSAVVLGTLDLQGGQALAAVRFVRGPLFGSVAYRVKGCPAGGELVDLGTGTRRAWERGEAGIFAAIAAAACARPHQPKEHFHA